MRRILAAAVLGGTLFAAAACGGSDNGGDGGDPGDTGNGGATGSPSEPAGAPGSSDNEAICAEGEALVTDFGTEFQGASGALAEAAATGDEAAMEEAAGELTGVTTDTASDLRDLAATAEDPEMRAAIEDLATELEGFGDAIAADPSQMESLDTTALDEAFTRIGEFCPTE